MEEPERGSKGSEMGMGTTIIPVGWQGWRTDRTALYYVSESLSTSQGTCRPPPPVPVAVAKDTGSCGKRWFCTKRKYPHYFFAQKWISRKYVNEILTRADESLISIFFDKKTRSLDATSVINPVTHSCPS